MKEKGGAKKAFLAGLDYSLFSMVYLTRFLARFIPPAALDSLYDLLGAAAFRMLPGVGKRLVVKAGEILGEDLDRGELERICRGVFASAVKPILDMALLWKHGERMMAELRVEGMEHLEEAESGGKGVLLLFVHTGSYDISPVIFYRIGKPFTPVMFHPNSTPVHRYVAEMAVFGQILGCDRESPVFWAGRDTSEKVLRHLGKGKRVAIALDVDGPRVVDFFGRPAALADGIARFALETGAPIVPFAILRGPGPLERRLLIYPPLRYEVSGDSEADISAIMREAARAGERMIREDPGQWMSLFGIHHWWEKAERITAERAAERGGEA